MTRRQRYRRCFTQTHARVEAVVLVVVMVGGGNGWVAREMDECVHTRQQQRRRRGTRAESASRLSSRWQTSAGRRMDHFGGKTETLARRIKHRGDRCAPGNTGRTVPDSVDRPGQRQGRPLNQLGRPSNDCLRAASRADAKQLQTPTSAAALCKEASSTAVPSAAAKPNRRFFRPRET